ncbi:MAG: hypothetical protein J7J93_00965 [Candidatus Aenigmarchaeota archaeon]|nr:hypothetical protein [Candidatus Aenigmarchaeota archaeon]
MQKDRILFFITLSIVYLSLINSVYASWYHSFWSTKYLANLFGLESSWLVMPDFLWKLLMPFIAIWAIVLGFLKQIKILPESEKLEIIISFTMAFLTLPSRIFVVFVGFFAGLSAALAVTVYFCMFIVGVVFYGFRFWRRENLSNEILKAYYKRKNNLEKELDDVRKDIKKEYEKDKIDEHKIENLTKKEKELVNELKKLKETQETA